MHLAAGLQHFRLVGFQVEVEVCERVVLDVARGVAQRLELRQPRDSGGAAGDEAGPLRASAFCRPALASASWAFSLKAGEVATCMAESRDDQLSAVYPVSGAPATRLGQAAELAMRFVRVMIW